MNRIVILLVAILLLLSCNKTSDIAGGVETGNGYASGIIMASNGTPTEAIISLVPESFNPSINELPDSLKDTTDNSGNYEISAMPGIYNVIAQEIGSDDISLIRSITITGNEENQVTVNLDSSVVHSYFWDSVPADNGVLYFKGTTIIVDYSASSDSVVLSGLPITTELPALHKYESGVDTVLASSLSLSGSVLIKSSPENIDGFTRLMFDVVNNQLWTGTDSNGILIISPEGVLIRHDSVLRSEHFENSITTIEQGFDKVLIGTGSGLLQFNEESYQLVDGGQLTGTDTVFDAFYGSDTLHWSAFENGVHHDHSTIALAGTKAIAISSDTVFAGTDLGEIYAISIDTEDKVKRIITLSSIYALQYLENGTILAATDDGLDVVDGETVTTTYSELDNVLRIREFATGDVYILNESNKLYKLSSAVLSIVSGYESLVQDSDIVDFDFDNLGRIWLLLENGSLLRVNRN